jgi:hypothetical protein
MEKLRKLSMELPKLNVFKKDSREVRSNNNLSISGPSDFRHNFSVKFDEYSKQLVGMPEDWNLMLKKNDIK